MTAERATSFYPQENAQTPLPSPDQDAETELARLAILHNEATETAQYANLLGRAPYAVALLAIGSGVFGALAAVSRPGAEVLAWLVLLLIGLAALARAYGRAIHAPFERAPLAAFTHDCSAILTYAGCAWGAGAFLALPDGTDPLAALAFAIVVPGLMTAVLRSPRAALLFLGPAAGLSALAMILRPLPEDGLVAAATLIAAGGIGAAALWAERLSLHGRTIPQLAKQPFG